VDWTSLLVGALVGVLLALVLARRAGRADAAATMLLGRVDRLQADLSGLGRTQDRLHDELLRGREASVRELGLAAEGLRGDIGEARRALAEVKALERASGSQLDRATDSLRRLEVVLAGSASRGLAGERILGQALGQLPPELLERGATFGGRVVEFALRLPAGHLLPIDSKWTGVADLEQLETTADPEERRRRREQIARDLRLRVREMARYLDPERTLGLAVLAVPDAVHAAAPGAHTEGWRDGVLVVPYSLTLPFVLSLYRLAGRFGGAPDAAAVAEGLLRLGDALGRLDETVEGRLSRALVLAANARDALRADLAEARGAVARIDRDAARQRGPREDAAAPAAFDRSTAPG
jgi:DNA recombination protein RmuC